MTIDEIRADDKVQLNLHGRIDANASGELQNAILQTFQKNSKVILNFSDVPYIASAGLRALLIGQKTASSKGGSFTIINVNEAVMEVFRVTSLNNVLTIQ